MKAMSPTKSPIKPSDINAKQHFYDAFGNCETEVSAGWIVKFCQKAGDWVPFTYEQIDAYYARWIKDGFLFNNLNSPQWLTKLKGDNGQECYRVTPEFIAQCYAASPKGERGTKKCE